MAPMKSANSSLSALGTTIFEVMSRLADEHRAVNLGQGFPDEGYPADVLERAAQETLHGWNQYPSTMGVPELRQAVAEHGGRFYDLDVDWRREVMVTSGATEALAASLLGLIEPGDEVVVFQPLYDSYLPMIRRGGGVPRFVDLRPPDWSFDPAELRAAFSPRTKLVLLNDPLNPAAKVWSADELAQVAALVAEFDAYAVCDEVYEHVVFDGARHVPLMTLPGMRNRCVKIGSAGKTFSLTGWKVGYITASPDVLAPIAKAHQFLTYTTPPNLQQAVAYGLGMDDSYFAGLSELMASRRDLLASGLQGLGFEVLACGGTYFLDVDISGLGWDGTDADFCQWLVKEAGVALIPLSAFYDRDPLTTVVRFCFCKKVSTLEAGLERLSKQFG
jgi:aspartate/methionine/tyrosine aminotransferase